MRQVSDEQSVEVGQVVAQLDSEGGQRRPCGSAIGLFGWEVKADRPCPLSDFEACLSLPCRAPSHQACVEAAPLARSTLCSCITGSRTIMSRCSGQRRGVGV